MLHSYNRILFKDGESGSQIKCDCNWDCFVACSNRFITQDRLQTLDTFCHKLAIGFHFKLVTLSHQSVVNMTNLKQW